MLRAAGKFSSGTAPAAVRSSNGSTSRNLLCRRRIAIPQQERQSFQIRVKSTLMNGASKNKKSVGGGMGSKLRDEVRRNFRLAMLRPEGSGSNTKVMLGGAAVAVLALGQILFGEAENFCDLRVTTKKKPVDIVDFYGTESAMEMFSVFPFVTHFLMRRGDWDDESVFRVPVFFGTHLSARIEFQEEERDLSKYLTTEQRWDKFNNKAIVPGEDDDDDDDDDDEDDEEEDDDGDEGPLATSFFSFGKKKEEPAPEETGSDEEDEGEGEDGDDGDEEGDEDEDDEEEEETEITGYFVKKERFRLLNSYLGRHLFDVTWEFGFHVKDDNETVEIFHKGIHFSGFWPFLLVWQIQGLYFMWAVDRYINNPVFGNEELEDQSVRYRRNLPMATVKEILYDLTEDVRQARQWAKKNSQATEAYDETLEDVKTLLLKAGYTNVDAIEVQGTGIKLSFKDDVQSQNTLRRMMTLRDPTAGRAVLSRRTTLKQYSDRASEKVRKANLQQQKTIGQVFEDMTADARAIEEFEKENGGGGEEEEEGPPKDLDIDLLRRNSMVDMNRPGVKENSFDY